VGDVTVIEELRARRDLLAQPGVWSGTYPPIGCSCLVLDRTGAENKWLSSAAEQALDAECRTEESDDAEAIAVAWNEAPRRTVAEVLDLLDRTIARLEATR
jgi:hypothetical protein